MKYWAFLSYSHADKKWGDWLHKALETYRVPRRLIGRDSRDGKVPARVYPIFRDREELPVSADLGSNINEALRESRYLIVICSPRSAQSRWVGEEIKTYKRLGHEDRILALIVDGEPNASDGKAGFKVDEECFPEAMRYHIGPDGALSPQRTEPIAADAREGKDGKHNAKLKLLAGLLGINYDDLKRREQERKMRRLQALVGVVSILLLTFAALGIFAWRQKLVAENALAKVSHGLSQSAFLEGCRLIENSDTQKALAYLARAIRVEPNNHIAGARLLTLLTQRNWDIPTIDPLDGGGPLQEAYFSPDGKRILTESFEGVIRLWDSSTGQRVAEFQAGGSRYSRPRFNPNGKMIFSVDDNKDGSGTLRLWDATTGKALGTMHENYGISSFQFNTSGNLVLLTCQTKNAGYVELRDVKTLTALFPPIRKENAPDENKTSEETDQSESEDNQPIKSAALSPDGKLFAVIFRRRDHAQIFRASDGRAVSGELEIPSISELPDIPGRSNMEFSPDSRRILFLVEETETPRNAAQLFNATTGRPVQGGDKFGPVFNAEYSPDGKWLVTSEARTVFLRDASTLKVVTKVAEASSPPAVIVFGPDSRYFALIARVHASKALGWSADIYSTEERQLTKNVLSCSDGAMFTGASFNADGSRLLASSDVHAALLQATDKPAQSDTSDSFKPLARLDHDDTVTSATFSPDNKWILTASVDGIARLWPAAPRATGAALPNSSSEEQSQSEPDSSSEEQSQSEPSDTQEGDTQLGDGSKISITDTTEEKVQWLKSDTARLLRATIVSAAGANYDKPRVTFSPDKKRVVIVQGRTLRLFDGVSGKALGQPINCRVSEARSAPTVSAPTFSLDGRLFAIAVHMYHVFGYVQVFDTSTGAAVTKQLSPIGSDAEEFRKPPQFSPDGRLVAAAGKYVGIAIWDVSTGQTMADQLPAAEDARFSFRASGPVLSVATDRDTYDIGLILGTSPSWLGELAEATGGYHVNDAGILEPVQHPAELTSKASQQLQNSKEDTPIVQWGRWFLADRSTRMISPFSKTKISDPVVSSASPAGDGNDQQTATSDTTQSLGTGQRTGSERGSAPFEVKELSNEELKQSYKDEVAWIKAHARAPKPKSTAAPTVIEPSASSNEQKNSVTSVDDETVRQFVRDYYAALSRHDLNTVVSKFSDAVDYEGQGHHDRKYIKTDIANYFRRWDKILFEAGEINVSRNGDGSFVVSFNFPFAVSKGRSPEKQGVTSNVWVLREEPPGNLQIVSQKEKVIAGGPKQRTSPH
jgi:WD40 repeat protein/ketosteroid isomerase-like protein